MKRAILTTLLVVCAQPALAAELEFSAGGEAEYDDNVFRTSEDKDEDLLFRLRPGFRIYEDRGDDLNFSAGYEAPIEFSVDNSDELNEVDHVGTGRFSYHVNPRLELFGTEQYGYIRSTLRQQNVDTDTVSLSQSPSLSDQRDRIKVNDAALGATYNFSPRTVGRLVASSSFFDSSRGDRARVWSAGAFADAMYKLTLKHQIGAGGGYTYQDFDDRQDIPGSQTNSYRLFGSWRWLVTQKTSFELTAGPAYLETEQDDADRVRLEPLFPSFPTPVGLLVSDFASCGSINGFAVASSCPLDLIITDPAAISAISSQTITVVNPLASGESDEKVTGFAEAVLSQRWTPTLASALRYSRQQGNASGVGGTVIEDVVALSNTWDFAARWQLALRGDYVRRESAFDIAQTYDVVVLDPGGTGLAARNGIAFNSTRNVEIDTDTWGVGARITHQLFKTTSIYVQARYSEQESKSGSLGNSSDFENFLATFGVRHVFEPIPLW